jgi:hypothetical protein
VKRYQQTNIHTAVKRHQQWNRHCSSNYFGLLFTEWRDFLAVSIKLSSTRLVPESRIQTKLIYFCFNIFSELLSSLGFTHANSFALRSHTCGELRKSDVGRKVKLSGWVQFQRLNKFVLLRDAYGVTQLVVPDEVCTPKRLIEVLGNVELGDFHFSCSHIFSIEVGHTEQNTEYSSGISYFCWWESCSKTSRARQSCTIISLKYKWPNKLTPSLDRNNLQERLK